ncbi:MAG: HAD hydrolase-like protein [Clostridia bacterium]|nr:HAD hydrolase-like protein [Clostridia bacterium]
MKKYTHIIWDFNGTLFDDVDAGILSVNKMLSDRGLPQIESREAYQKVFKFPIIEYYRDVGFDFEAEPYTKLAPIWVELYNEYSRSSHLQSGALEVLENFKDQGV